MKLYKTNERPLMLALLVILICFAGVQYVNAAGPIDWNYGVSGGNGSQSDPYRAVNTGLAVGFTGSQGSFTSTGFSTFSTALEEYYTEIAFTIGLTDSGLISFNGNPFAYVVGRDYTSIPDPELSLSHYTIYTTTGVIATISDMPSGIDSIHWENNGIPIPLKDRYVMGWGKEWLWISQVGANTITAKLYEGAALKHTLSKTVTYQIWQPGDPIPQGYKVDPTNPNVIIPMAETREEFIRQQQQEKINSTPLIGAHLLALTDTIDHYGSSFFNMTMNTTSLLLSPLTAINYHLNSAITTFEDVGTIAIEETGLSFLMQVSNRVLSAIPPIIINLISLALIGDTIYLFLNRQV
jgi:hypothetical protein